MKFIKPVYILFLTMIMVLFSCNYYGKNKSATSEITSESTIKYAKGFDIQYFETHKKLIVKAPFLESNKTFEFILTKNNTTNALNSIQTPVKSLVVTSTTHIPFIELLHSEDILVGFPNTDYISSKQTRVLIEKGAITDLGNEENINTELLLDLRPEIVVGFSLNSNNKMFATIEKLGIPVLFNGDWLEETPLGRAEWIKFFGVLFDKEKEADSIFKNIENNYLEAKAIAFNSTNQPTIISGGLFKDIWNLPAGESFEATFLNDANADYLWKGSKGKGSLSLNIENVFEKGKLADFWISPSFYNTKKQLKDANDIYPKFKAFQLDKVYTYVNKRGEKGGILYFELAPARPDLVLKDLIKIVHPKLLGDYEFSFYEQLK